MKKMIALMLTILICLVAIMPNFVLANDIKTDGYKDIYKANKSNNGKLISAGEQALAIAQVIGVTFAVICLLILGIKYMIMSTDAGAKANIKEKLVPYVIGAVLLFGSSGLLGIVSKFAYGLK